MSFEDRFDAFDEWLDEGVDSKRSKLSSFKSVAKQITKDTPLHYIISLSAVTLLLFGLSLAAKLNGTIIPIFRINWFVVFIFYAAWRKFNFFVRTMNHKGKVTADMYTALTSGIITFFAGFIFLFQLDWSLIWPFFILIGGFLKLFGEFVLEDEQQ